MSRSVQKKGIYNNKWENVTVQKDSAVDKMFAIYGVKHVQVTYEDGAVQQWRIRKTAENVAESVSDGNGELTREQLKQAVIKALREADLLKED